MERRPPLYVCADVSGRLLLSPANQHHFTNAAFLIQVYPEKMDAEGL